jgi:MoxR-like ATPase
VIITSNNEKELPDAFLRRCVFHYIEFPSRDLMARDRQGSTTRTSTDKRCSINALEVFFGLRSTPQACARSRRRRS